MAIAAESPVIAEDVVEILQLAFPGGTHGKAAADLQAHEVFSVLTIPAFLPAMRQVASEILQLEGLQPCSLTNDADLVQFFEHRGYFFGPDISLERLECRMIALYEALGDLLATRCLAGKCLNARLPKPCKDATFDKISTALSRVATVAGHPQETTIETLVPLLQPRPFPNHLLLPHAVPDKMLPVLVQLTRMFNDEYRLRRVGMLARFDGTLLAMLWSDKCSDPENQSVMSSIITTFMERRASLETNSVTLWEALTALKSLHKSATEKVAMDNVKTALKALIIGTVPNRGGTLESFSARQVAQDVSRANAALKQKSAHEERQKDRASRELYGTKRDVTSSDSPATKRWRGGGRGDGQRRGTRGRGWVAREGEQRRGFGGRPQDNSTPTRQY